MKKSIFVCLMMAVCLMFAGCSEKEIKGLGRFEGLDPAIELQIIKSYYGDKDPQSYYLINDYYGTYNGYVVIRILEGWSFGMGGSEMVDSLEFKYYNAGRIKVWKAGIFYYMQEAYDNDFLSKSDLETIYAHNIEFYPYGT